MSNTLACGTMEERIAGASSAHCGERQYANVLGVCVDAVDMEQAIAMVGARLLEGPKGYVCFLDVHGILAAMKSTAVANTFEQAAMALPDGTPTMWVGRAQGCAEMDYVTGPDFMHEIFRREEFACYSHFLYGGRPGVAEELAAMLRIQFPWARIAGTYTPPFRDLKPEEEAELVAEIGRLKPGIVWVGIGAPRQDLWMRRMLPLLDVRMMFGVGAAFDFLSGRIRPCPEWVKKAGFHWLHRLVQDPVRLWPRNMHNMAFLWHIALQLSGAKRYPMRSSMTAPKNAQVRHYHP